MTKEETTIPVSSRLSSEQIAAIKLSGESSSDFIRKAVDERLSSQNIEFIKGKLANLKEECKLLERKEKELESREKDKETISKEEVEFFIESGKILVRRPEVLDGRINLYSNVFMKPYKLTRKEFLAKIKEVTSVSNGEKT